MITLKVEIGDAKNSNMATSAYMYVFVASLKLRASLFSIALVVYDIFRRICPFVCKIEKQSFCEIKISDRVYEKYFGNLSL